MALNAAPLGSPAFYTSIYFNQKNAVNDLSDSVARLSSGNRLVNIADDVASFSLASRLQSQVANLKQLQQNISQGISLVQVASGGLQQIRSTLQSLESVAIQANSAALSNTDRSFLQQRFTSLLDSIDDVVDVTSFNRLRLLDGALAGGSTLKTDTTSATRATGTITFNGATSNGELVSVNNVLFEVGQSYEGVTFTAGTASQSATNLAAVLSASNNAAVSGYSYSADNGVLTITARSGGTLGNQFILSDGQSTANVTASGVSGYVGGATPPRVISGGADDGLSIGAVRVSGSIGNNVATDQNQTPASRLLTINGTVLNTDTITFSGANSSTVFSFTDGTPADQFDIKIGATREETLQNIVSTLQQFVSGDSSTGADANDTRYDLAQLRFEINGDSLVISSRLSGNPEALQINGGAATLSVASTGNIAASGAAFNNGVNTGVNASNVSNSAFVGRIQGFSATYVGADSLTASVSVGGVAYTASIADTTPAGDTNVTFKSSSGGSFNVLLKGGSGSAVGNQSDANAYATRLNEAFSTLTFTQERSLTNFVGTGLLSGGKASLQTDSASAPKVLNSVTVTPPASGPYATINLNVDGVDFRSGFGVGGSIGAFETITLTNVNNPNQSLRITNGGTARDFSTAEGAAAFQQAIEDSFSLSAPGGGVNFQIGELTTDVINVNIPASNSAALFNDSLPSVATQDDAAAAQTAIQSAQDSIDSLISYAGGKLSAFETAAASTQQVLTGVQAANSALADTDIIEESSNFAQKMLQVNASIAVIAQVLRLPNSLVSTLSTLGNR